jgi:hypothetical protein
MEQNKAILAQEELNQALHMIVEAYKGLGFNNDYVVRIVNLITEGFITKDGKFTEEYMTLAKQAIDIRNNANKPHIIIPNN